MEYDGVVLAAAGLERLGWEGQSVRASLIPNSACQIQDRALSPVEARVEDSEVGELLAVINHPQTWSAVTAERAFVEATDGGCRVPVAAYATESQGTLSIRSMACLPDGSRIFRSSIELPGDDPVGAGQAAARALEETGAMEIMYAARIV